MKEERREVPGILAESLICCWVFQAAIFGWRPYAFSAATCTPQAHSVYPVSSDWWICSYFVLVQRCERVTNSILGWKCDMLITIQRKFHSYII